MRDTKTWIHNIDIIDIDKINIIKRVKTTMEGCFHKWQE